MIYGSVCSGIEAVSVAWEPLGFRAAWFAEIDPAPSAVLAHRFPGVKNRGDFTRIEASPKSIDVLVGGTPCQSFSVAGLRKGLADDRGNLALEFLRLADRTRPTWLVWENVPGVLSSNGGRDFGAFLGGLAELGYGWAYRVLDAQFFGVPQRRRRVFVVGHLGDWRRAAAVLFERHSLSGHPAPRREAGERAAFGLACRTRGDSGKQIEWQENVSYSLNAVSGGGRRDENMVAHTLRADGFDASKDGTGRGTPLVPVPFDTTQITSNGNYSNPKPGDPCRPLAAGAHAPAIAFQCQSSNVGPMGTLRSGNGNETGGVPLVAAIQDGMAMAKAQNGLGINGDGSAYTCDTTGSQSIATGMAVRRLTPRECERLQGFPDDWTLVPHRGKPMADGPRYKMIGNSMAVPCMRWIGQRLQTAAALFAEGA